jgi:uncharacterized protein
MVARDGVPVDPAALQIWRAADRVATPWRNGGGITREVAREPADLIDAGDPEFDWRISVAEVTASGPFSTFEGVERTIVLIDGPAMTLAVDGRRQTLRRFEPLTFDGASPTSCELPHGPTRDLNVMTTRGRASATVDVLELSAGATITVEGADPLVLLAISGEVRATSSLDIAAVLGPLDALGWFSSSSLAVTGTGVAVAVRLRRAGRHRSTAAGR